MAIKCIALDMDCTTLNKAGKLSEGNRQALEYAIAKGVEIIIASGRSYGSLPKDVCAVAGIHYAITSNGAAVYRVPGGEKVRQLHMEAKTVGDVMRLTEGEHIAYEVFIDGGRTATGADAIEWTKKVVGYGVRTVLPTSKSTDGVRTGYDLPLIRKIREVTDADIVASGGAGTMEHFKEALTDGCADAALAASLFHYHEIDIADLKAYLKAEGISVRPAQ